MLQSGGQNQKWPTSGPSGYVTLDVSGGPYASERGTKLERAHKCAQWLHDRGRLGGLFRTGGQYQKWPTSGPSSYITPTVWGVPCALEQTDKNRSGPQVGPVAT